MQDRDDPSDIKPTYLSFLELGDYTSEFEAAHRLAIQGDAKAMFHLSNLYVNGRGTSKSAKEATKWCKQAASLGISEAQFFLAYYYEHGIGCDVNHDQARVWYRKSALGGNTGAMYFLALMDSFSNDSQVKIEALAWSRIAALDEIPFAIELSVKLSKSMTQSEIERASVMSDAILAGNPITDEEQYGNLFENE